MNKIKLFGKWGYEGIEVEDPVLKNVICLRPVYVPHTSGRRIGKSIPKANTPIVERLINKLMKKGRNTGKKLKTMRIVETAFEIIHLKTGENPIKVLVKAVENAAIKEEVTRIVYGGIIYHKSVDVSPIRRVDVALRLIVEAVQRETFNNAKSVDEILADVLIATANNDASRSYAIKRKDEIERIALSAR